MKRLLIIFMLIPFFEISLEAQDITVKAAFDTSRIYIGDQINYTVTIDQPSDIALITRPLKDTLCRNIEILSGPVTDSIVKGDRLMISSRYLVTSFDSGFYQVLPYYAETKDAQGLKRYYSDYAVLEVMRVRITPPDTTSKIFDIIEPYKSPLTIGEVLPWVLIVAAAAVLIWLFYRYIKSHKRKKDEPEVVVNPDPAHIIAFRDLENLKNEELWQKGEVKLYYSKLTEILRQYLENRYGVFSLELTTSETLEALVRTGFRKDEAYQQLSAILKGADLVKFAKHKPSGEENEDHFKNAWNFVDRTKQAEEAGPVSNNAEGKEAAK